MKVSFCPVCDAPADPQFQFCQSCGVDLALAATIAEDALSSTAGSRLPVSPEVLVPLLGEKLVKRGGITEEDLRTALLYQNEQTELGTPVLLGQALIHLGFIDRVALDQTITAQIVDLQSALNRSNRNLEKRVQEYTADLQNALQKLAELNQLKSNFIANISHELRTPLTHVKGYLELLADHTLGNLSAEQDEAMMVMTRGVDRLETLINDLIKFSETAKGGLSIQIDQVSIGKIIGQTLAKSVDKAKKRGVVLNSKTPQTLPDVSADEENIHWVISQLVDNAIKFSNPGGKVSVLAETNDSLVTISVIDSGIGIPRERLDEIFLPFHQLDNSPRRRYGGTGMGLALVKRILEAHNTSLHIQSLVDKGSLFRFSLPISEASTVSRAFRRLGE
jgi:signal transduction histidine kinase